MREYLSPNHCLYPGCYPTGEATGATAELTICDSAASGLATRLDAELAASEVRLAEVFLAAAQSAWNEEDQTSHLRFLRKALELLSQARPHLLQSAEMEA